MILGDLGSTALTTRLRGGGLYLRTGPVVTRIESPLHAIQQSLALHYARHVVEPDDGFADFHVRIDRPRSMRRWIEPQVVFSFDGTEPFTPLRGDQAFAVLEWGLNWCVSMHCHQYLIVHAAVLERNGRALLLPAPSGSGKSTLCAGLVLGGGWRLLSDELALIDPVTAEITPLPRPLSLKNASIEVIRAFAPEAVLGDTVHDTPKGRVAYARAPYDSVARAAEAALPGWIVLPRYVVEGTARLQPASKARTFMSLVDNAFNYNMHGRDGFNAFAAMIERSDCFEFSYSSLPEAAALFDRLAATR